MKTKIFAFVAIALLLINCKGKPENDANIQESLEPKAFIDKIQSSENAQVVDVRTPDEFNSKHLDNAINIDYNSADFESGLKQLDKSKPTFVYCLSGGRSSSAASKMHELGFEKVYEMEGGMMKYNAAGLGEKVAGKEGMSIEDFNKLLKTDKKVVLDFYAEWCGPCKKMAPYLEKMKTEMSDKVTIVRIDVDQNETLTDAMHIESLPTILVYENQKETWKSIGFISEEELKKHL